MIDETAVKLQKLRDGMDLKEINRGFEQEINEGFELEDVASDYNEICKIVDDVGKVPEFANIHKIFTQALDNRITTINDLERDIKYIQQAIDTLKTHKANVETELKKLKKKTITVIKAYPKLKKFAGKKGKLRIKRTHILVIEDETKIHPSFFDIKEIRTPRKNDIKAAIKAGQDVAGAKLIENQYLEIRKEHLELNLEG